VVDDISFETGMGIKGFPVKVEGSSTPPSLPFGRGGKISSGTLPVQRYSGRVWSGAYSGRSTKSVIFRVNSVISRIKASSLEEAPVRISGMVVVSTNRFSAMIFPFFNSFK